MKHLYLIFCVLIFPGWTTRSSGQNLDPKAYTGGDKKLHVHGGLSANAVYNSNQSFGAPVLSYFLSGNVDLSYRTFTLPFTFSYSNRTFNYSQPFSFNFVTFRPTYKWISAQIGTGFTTFSPYSLNGHQYQGVGLSLTPGRWSVDLMYGRLLKATPGNPETLLLPTYRRMGMGIKTRYQADAYMLGFSLFRAADDPGSLPALPDSARPQPKENLVVGLEFSTTLFKKLQLNGEYYSSTLNADRTQTGGERVNRRALSALLMGRRSVDVESFNSFRAGLNYNLSRVNGIIGIDYQRVDPGYVTLGGYYFVNDLESIAATYSQSFWQGKVSFSGNVGLQRDNIEAGKSSSQRRVVGAANVNARLSDRLNIGLNFSNYTSYAFIRTAFDDIKQLNPFEQLDTLNYRQINQNFSTNISYALSTSEERVQSLNLNASLLQSVTKQGEIVRIGQQSGFINSTLTYTYSQPRKKQSFGLGLNTSYNTIGTRESVSLGPLLNIQKSFRQDQINTNASLAYIHIADRAFDDQTGALNLRAGASYKVDKHNNLTSNLGLTRLSGTGINARSYVSLTVGYVNRF